MEVEYQNNREDFIDFFKIQLIDRFNKLDLFLLITSIIIIAIFSGNPFNWIGCLVALLIYGCFIFGYFYLFPLRKAMKLLDSQLEKESAFTERRKVIIDDEGLRTIGSEKNVFRSWDTIIAVNSNKKFVYVTLIDKRPFFIAKKWFSSDNQMSDFMGFIRSKIIITKEKDPLKLLLNSSRPSSSIPANSKSKPPYLLGLLGFIPLVGAFVGVALILYGLIKYKDKWLVVIGIGGVLFTVFVYSLIGPNSKSVNQGFTKIDINQLNSLIKEIEFYKTQNGSYPDSLAQLDIKDSFTSTSDALINYKKNDKHDYKYNYHKIGSKYTLFSSGEDETPNTKDDIYPTVDTAKTGLIIPAH